MIALQKKSSGIRPIAVGYTLRRIAAKCANSYATKQLAGYFSPIQLGVGTSGGSEAAVHATRRFIEAMPSGYVVAKLDFCNAFNRLRGDLMLRSVLSTVPGIYRFCHLTLQQPIYPQIRRQNNPVTGGSASRRSTGLGSLLFCVSIHPDLLRLQYELVAGFMNDLTLGGPPDVVAADLDYISSKQDGTGLRSTLPSRK